MPRYYDNSNQLEPIKVCETMVHLMLIFHPVTFPKSFGPSTFVQSEFKP